MPARPLLMLPTPERIAPRRGPFGGSKLREPGKNEQIAHIDPVFARLRALVDGDAQRVLELREDPTALAPERVIVFEIAGTVQAFTEAIQRVPGLEFLAEQEVDRPPDNRFAAIDTRKGHEGEDRTDKSVNGRLYLAMPNVVALRQLLGLWQRWVRGETLGYGLAPFNAVFSQLRDLRPWGPVDRIPDETITYWREETARNPERLVRTEVELWYHADTLRREQASRELRQLARTTGGTVVHEVIISEIRYHGALIDLQPGEIPGLIQRGNISLVLADDVMFYRPQSLLRSPTSPLAAETVETAPPTVTLPPAPIAALLDGVPIQAHRCLLNRLMVDDPDGLESEATVSRRRHGTAMASLIVHGDLNLSQEPLNRLLYVRPILSPDANGEETTGQNALLVDTIYRAILRIKGSRGEPGVAPNVFLVNLSVGDPRRPFAGLVSPLARLLDYLSDRYGILFLVSGGNVTAPISISGFENWTEYASASPLERQKATLAALNAGKHQRTILSPGESLNALSIGAQHHDNVAARQTGFNSIDPYFSDSLPNPSSGLGLGVNRAVKPDIHLPGGREYVRMQSSGNGVTVALQASGSLFGLRAASPDPSGQARLNYSALSDGTSSATALATRAAHQIFDAMMNEDGVLSDMDPIFYAVVVKTLLVHRARWSEVAEILKEVCGPHDRGRHIELAENVSRFVGFGVPNIAEAIECSASRATLVGYGELMPNEGHQYRIPLPASLERVKDPRSLTVTLAWFSPIRPSFRSYRAIRLEAEPLNPKEALGVERASLQPYDRIICRGTVFHERYDGEDAVPFLDDGRLALRVWAKPDGGGVDGTVRYGVAVTIEAGAAIPVYDEIRQQLLVPIRQRTS